MYARRKEIMRGNKECIGDITEKPYEREAQKKGCEEQV